MPVMREAQTVDFRRFIDFDIIRFPIRVERRTGRYLDAESVWDLAGLAYYILCPTNYYLTSYGLYYEGFKFFTDYGNGLHRFITYLSRLPDETLARAKLDLQEKSPWH